MRSSKMSLNSLKFELKNVFACYVQLKTPSKLNLWFQRYSHFKAAQNNQIQRKVNAIICCYILKILFMCNSQDYSLSVWKLW